MAAQQILVVIRVLQKGIIMTGHSKKNHSELNAYECICTSVINTESCVLKKNRCTWICPNIENCIAGAFMSFVTSFLTIARDHNAKLLLLTI
jgi:hypothetical protein